MKHRPTLAVPGLLSSICFHCEVQSGVLTVFKSYNRDSSLLIFVVLYRTAPASASFASLNLFARSCTFRYIKGDEELGKLTNLHPSDTTLSHSQQTSLLNNNINGFFRIRLRHHFHVCRA